MLGGFTTFSTAVLDAHSLAVAGRAGTALARYLGTAVLALAAVWGGLSLARAVMAAGGVTRGAGGAAP